MEAFHIGTSGWHYKHWTGTFYPEGTRGEAQMEYYLKFFRTVELNNSFYGLPKPETFRNWARKSPPGFIFSIKANRFFTHMKKLKVEKKDFQEFFSRISVLEDKAGPVLFQLPPGWKINTERLASFLAILPKSYRYAMEFRNHSWYDPEVYRLLREHGVAFCIYELAGHLSPIEITAGFVYVRLHGPGAKYEGSYSEKSLRQWAERSEDWQRQGKEVFIYFDNDQLGYAAFNALELSRILGIKKPSMA